jgi:cellulose synthase/poly-beta-1,6-N-acetylglucosamine synthase-like glycosyltransferase
MTPILVLIPACNEAGTIGDTVAALACLLVDDDRLVVVDDGSTDDTALIAGQAGAAVLKRCLTDTPGRKGAAIAWALGQIPTPGHEIVVILDADARVDPRFLACIRARFAAGAQAVQSYVMPVTEFKSPVSSLAACSTLMEQVVDDGLRSRLGWPVRLRGTGMAFQRELLAKVAPQLRTTVEDVELSLLLVHGGTQVAFAPEAIVYDPLPASMDAASRQRARWLAGQGDVLRLYWPMLIGLLLRGPGAWSLIGSVLLKPRAVFAVARSGALALSLLWPPAWPLTIFLALTLLMDIFYLGAAIALFGAARQKLLSLEGVPLYGVMWLRSVGLALRGTRGWLRARP